LLLKAFMPDLAEDSIHSLDLNVLWQKGIRGIILDIDNTLESHRVLKPSSETLAFLKNLKDTGFKVCLISNGKEDRVRLFNEDLGYFAMAKAGKPKKKGYRLAQKEMGLSNNQVAMIGDQIFTDVFGAKRCGFFSILVEPIESIENGFFYIKRFFEKNIRNKAKEKTKK